VPFSIKINNAATKISIIKNQTVLLIILLLSLKTIHTTTQTPGSVSKRIGTTATANLFPNCATSNHLSPVGTITPTDNKVCLAIN
jgi:hypothetical protein